MEAQELVIWVVHQRLVGLVEQQEQEEMLPLEFLVRAVMERLLQYLDHL